MKSLTLTLAAVILLFHAQFSYAEDRWTYLIEANDSRIYYDTQTINVDGKDSIKIWFKFENNDGTTLKLYNTFKCGKRLLYSDTLVSYNKNGDYINDTKDDKYRPIIPGTNFEYIYNYFCQWYYPNIK